MTRPSAGTRSPASTLTMSPGTRSAIGTCATSPPRRTLACTTIIFWSAATLASALPSWFTPMRALKTVRRMSTIPVGIWPGRNRHTTPAPSSTSCIGSRYWRRNARQRGSFGCLRELVLPVGRAPTVHLGGRESGSGIDRQCLEHRLGRQRMPCLLGLRGCRRSLLGHGSRTSLARSLPGLRIGSAARKAPIGPAQPITPPLARGVVIHIGRSAVQQAPLRGRELLVCEHAVGMEPAQIFELGGQRRGRLGGRRRRDRRGRLEHLLS